MCLFCEIARGERPAAIVLEERDHLVFLDKSPLFKGHCLVVPKAHYVALDEVPPPEIGALFTCVQRISRAVEAGMAADGYFVAINNRVSQSVPHLHVHVIPRRKKDGLRGFFWPRSRYADAGEMESVRAAIAGALEPSPSTSSD